MANLHTKAYAHIPDSDGKYLLINVVTRRARDLGKGTPPTIPYAEGNFDPLEVAFEEIEAGKLKVRRRNDITNEVEEFD
ncbi:MAG: polymerase Rpb6 [Candidatus Sumerlaeota bacterium]|nr:polymerase Rpb6 [Candidatus Sumerlaeota bacterium]